MTFSAIDPPLPPEPYGQSRQYYLLLVFLLAISYFPLFLHLDSAPIHAWDESMFALRAYHLANEGSLLNDFGVYEASFKNENIKPPFGTYFQALAFKILGYNELAVRLPVSLFCLATAVGLLWFFNRYFQKPLWGFFAALVLLCSPGYIYPHVARTGDHEGILACLLLAALLCFYLFVEKRQARWIYLTAAFFALAVITKSVAALFTLPALLFYLIYKGMLKNFLTDKRTWFALGLFVLIVLLQYGIIAITSPEHFKSLVSHSGSERFGITVHGHRAPFGFYFQELWQWKFFPWVLALPLGIGLVFTHVFRPYRDIVVLLFSASMAHILVISCSQTKLPWYDAAMYPWLAIITGFTLWAVWQGLAQQLRLANKAQALFAAMFTLSVFGVAYADQVEKNTLRHLYSPQQQVGALLKNVRDKNPQLRTFTVLDADPKGNLVAAFYIASMNEHHGFDVSWQNNMKGIAIGDTVAYCDVAINHRLDSLYSIEQLLWTAGCKVSVIKGYKIYCHPEQ